MLFSCGQFPFLNLQLGSGKEQMTPNGHKVVLERGRYVTFSMGSYNTDDPRIIELLLHHCDYNRIFYGPFSQQQIADGSYKELIKKHLTAEVHSNVVPDVDAIAKEGFIKGRASLPKIRNEPITPTSPTGGSTVLKAADIIARQTAEIKTAQAVKSE